MPQFSAVNVSKFAFFTVNLSMHFKFLVRFGVYFIFHCIYLAFGFIFLLKHFNTVGPLFFDRFSEHTVRLFFKDFSACMVSLFYKY